MIYTCLDIHRLYKFFLYVSYLKYILARTSEISSDMPKALKLPVFWPEAAEVWFVQADAQFAIKSITVSKT